jgi:histidine triad (HIT) family protein
MPDALDCVFCKIVAGRIPSARIWESAWAIAFLDIGPVALGHTLLVPREHFPTLGEMPPSLVSAVCGQLPALASAVQAASGGTGLNVLLNNGRSAGQVVEHVHFHLIPRHDGDGFRFTWPRLEYPASEMDQMRARIAALIAAPR